MLNLENGMKPSEITVPGTYIFVHTELVSEDPSKRMTIVDVWLDASGRTRALNGNALPVLVKQWSDKYVAYGPIVVPPPVTP